jgi:hypothetical protein
MIMPFVDGVAGTTVYINPDYVASLRPDPADPETSSIVKLRDGEIIKLRGSHSDIAGRLGRAAA